MKFEVVPEACKPTKGADGVEIPPLFTGQILLDLPPYPVLKQLQKEAIESMAHAKKSEEDIDRASMSLQMVIELYKKLEPMIAHVDLVHVAKNKSISNVQDFASYPPCGEIIEELCLKLAFGFVEKN